MKLIRFGERGRERPGIVYEDGRIRRLPEALGDLAGDRLSPDGLAEIAALDVGSLPVVEDGARVGACVARPGKFVCIGLNYRDHAAESGAQPPAEPVVFGKWTSAIVGPNDDVQIPVAAIVSYLSRFMTLEAGDIVATGTPAGVGLGQTPPVYLRAGQTVRLGIDRLGEQAQRIVAAR